MHGENGERNDDMQELEIAGNGAAPAAQRSAVIPAAKSTSASVA